MASESEVQTVGFAFSPIFEGEFSTDRLPQTRNLSILTPSDHKYPGIPPSDLNLQN